MRVRMERIVAATISSRSVKPRLRIVDLDGYNDGMITSWITRIQRVGYA
jgi:hypothetical protein